MGVAFKSFDYVTDPKNPQVNNNTFTTPPTVNMTLEYYSNCADDDLYVTVTNSFTGAGQQTASTNRNDFSVVIAGKADATFIGNDFIGKTHYIVAPSITISVKSGTYTRNQIVKIEKAVISDPPDFRYIGRLADGGNSSQPITLFNAISSDEGDIPDDTNIYSPKILKKITCSMFFVNPIISSGIYVATLTFKDMFSDTTILTKEIQIMYSATEISGGQMPTFYQHQLGYVNRDLHFIDCGRIMLVHDYPSIFSKPDSPFKYKIYLRGFKNKDGSQVIDDVKEITFTAKTDLDANAKDNLSKVPIKTTILG